MLHLPVSSWFNQYLKSKIPFHIVKQLTLVTSAQGGPCRFHFSLMFHGAKTLMGQHLSIQKPLGLQALLRAGKVVMKHANTTDTPDQTEPNRAEVSLTVSFMREVPYKGHEEA